MYHNIKKLLTGLATLMTSIRSISVKHEGRALSMNLMNELDDKIDWDDRKAYFLFNNSLQRWNMAGDNTVPENSVPWTGQVTGEHHRGMHIYNKDRFIHYTNNNFNVYTENLTLLNSSRNDLYAFTFQDTSNSWEYDRHYSMRGYTDRFIMRLKLHKNGGVFYKHALIWLDNNNRINYRWLPYIPNDPQDIVPIRKGAGIAIINKNSTIHAYELLNGNLLWKRDLNIGNPQRGVYIYPRCELVTLDNNEKLRVFDTVDGHQKPPPPIEWVNHTFRDFKVVRESDKIHALTNRRVMVIDADRHYRINQYRNTSVNPAGKYFRYHRANDRNEYILAYENEATHNNMRMMSIQGSKEEICHNNCEKTCKWPLRHCSYSTGTWWKRIWPFNICNNCTTHRWWCDLDDWIIWTIFAALLALFLLSLLLCLCCCFGNGTREVHTVENYRNKSAYVEEDEIVEPMREQVIVEEEVIETRKQPKVFKSQFSEERFVDNGRPAKKVSYSNFRADEYRDNGNVYVSNPKKAVVVEERVSVMKNSFNPYKKKY